MANNQRIRQAPGRSSPFVTLNPANIIANRAPTVHDMYEQGTIWFWPALNGVWALTSYAAGQAIWTFLVSAAGTVATLTGNDAVPVAPVGGNIDIVVAPGLGMLFTNTAPGVLTLGGVWDVVAGGTGDSSFTPYSVITGGTSATAPLQNVVGVGTSGEVLTSAGAGFLPTWMAPAASSISITGDVGGPLVGNNFTFTGGSTGLEFSGAGSTETLIGELVVPNGGTGAGTFNAYGVILGGTTATGALQSEAPSAALGIPLISAGVAAKPVFGTALVAGGGTGGVSHTAYAVLTGGTTSTGAIQSIASVGTSGQLLTSNGAGALPSFQAVPASSISITGDSGGALTGAAFTITGGSTGLTFAGAGSTETLGGDLVVANGGTGNTTFTAFAPVAAGTTATGPFQSVDTGIATSGFVLTSTGAGSLPTWQAAGGGGSGSFTDLTVDPGGVTFMATGNGDFAVGSNTYTGTYNFQSASTGSFSLNTNGGDVSIAGPGNGPGAGKLQLQGGSGTGGLFTSGMALYTTGDGDINIGSNSNAGIINLGISTTGGETINVGNASAAKTINIGNSNSGNITNLQSPITALPGPVYIYTGAGDPSNGLAINIGDLYIKTDASIATDRLWIATGAGAWAFFTASA